MNLGATSAAGSTFCLTILSLSFVDEATRNDRTGTCNRQLYCNRRAGNCNLRFICHLGQFHILWIIVQVTSEIIIITVTSRERHCVSVPRQLCLVGKHQRKRQSSASLSISEGNLPVIGRFPSQRSNYTESVCVRTLYPYHNEQEQKRCMFSLIYWRQLNKYAGIHFSMSFMRKDNNYLCRLSRRNDRNCKLYMFMFPLC